MNGGIHIFIACKTAGTRRSISSLLASSGHLIVGESEPSPSALRLIRSLEPDVVFIDIDYPQGREIAQLLEEESFAGLVLVSTHAGRNHGLTSGQIMKPVNETSVLTAVEFTYAGQLKTRELAKKLNRVQETLEVRKIVDRAKGILMDNLNISEGEAYRCIQKQSMDKRLSLRRVAEAIITMQEIKKN